MVRGFGSLVCGVVGRVWTGCDIAANGMAPVFMLALALSFA